MGRAPLCVRLQFRFILFGNRVGAAAAILRPTKSRSCQEAVMTWRQPRGLACAALFVAASVGALAAKADAPQTAGASAAAASPELVGALSKELAATPEQSAGAAGALFSLAKSRLQPAEFAQVSTAVPGMSSLLKAAPATGAGGAIGTAGALSQLSGSAAGLATAASAF